jgi:hypothetical protein
MTGQPVMEIIPQLGVIKIKSMYKLLQKLPLIKKVKLQLKQKLRQNPQQVKILKKNKIKKI